MNFIHLLLKLFGWLLLAFSGGCALYGLLGFGTGMIKKGRFDLVQYEGVILVIGVAVILVSGFLGWVLLKWGAGTLFVAPGRFAAKLLAIALLSYAAVITLLALDYYLNTRSSWSYFDAFMSYGVGIIGLGVPGFLLLWWGWTGKGLNKA